jgi:hypothetical protein
MHLDSDEREQAMAAIAEIAREGAQVFMFGALLLHSTVTFNQDS